LVCARAGDAANNADVAARETTKVDRRKDLEIRGSIGSPPYDFASCCEPNWTLIASVSCCCWRAMV
jgi:hypothetical protein